MCVTQAECNEDRSALATDHANYNAADFKGYTYAGTCIRNCQTGTNNAAKFYVDSGVTGGGVCLAKCPTDFYNHVNQATHP